VNRRTGKPSLPPYFAAMVVESQSAGLPTSHEADLTTHDRNALEQIRPGGSREGVTRIGWILYRNGTFLALLGARDELRKARELADFASVDEARHYVGEAGALRRVEREEWVALMSRSDSDRYGEAS
jgi:hypothetical protein